MRAIKKLKSNKGATLVFALAIFLVAMVISVSLIAVSLSATKSSASTLEDEQAYLAVSSAARIFQNEVENKRLVQTVWKENFAGKSAGYKTTMLRNISDASATPITLTGNGLPAQDPIGRALIMMLRGVAIEKIVVTAPDDVGCIVDIEFIPDTDPVTEYCFKAVFTAYDKNDTSRNNAMYSTNMYFYAFVGKADINGVVAGSTDRVKVKELTKVRWSVYGENTERGKRDG